MPLGLASANAHVTVKPDTAEAGAYSVLTFAASHGCKGSPTTSFTINIPDSIPDANPTIYPGWNVKRIEEKLKEPLTTVDGSTITKHIGKVVYMAQNPLEDGYRIVLSSKSKIPTRQVKPSHSPRSRPVRRARSIGPRCRQRARTRTHLRLQLRAMR